MAQTFQSPFGNLALNRYPLRRRETLQPWDAADLLLLQHVRDQQLTPPFLLVNDAFGALSVALADHECVAWSDSALSHQAISANSALNRRRAPTLLPATASPVGDFGSILLRLPKSHSLLKYQLQQLRALMAPQTVLVGAAMAKHIDRGAIDLFEQQLGPTQCSLAEKKARLIHPQVDFNRPFPLEDDRHWLELPEYNLALCNRAGVFSRGKLDGGSRLLIANLDHFPACKTVADLGCGNGLLGILLQRKQPGAHVYFFDESYLAVDCARQNHQHNIGTEGRADFIADNCLEHWAGHSFDGILCNPPFHQQHQVGDQIARQMFRDSRRHLRPGGCLWVVGNRHLGYHVQLKRLFGNCELVASDPRFVVLASQR